MTVSKIRLSWWPNVTNSAWMVLHDSVLYHLSKPAWSLDPHSWSCTLLHQTAQPELLQNDRNTVLPLLWHEWQHIVVRCQTMEAAVMSMYVQENISSPLLRIYCCAVDLSMCVLTKQPINSFRIDVTCLTGSCRLLAFRCCKSTTLWRLIQGCAGSFKIFVEGQRVWGLEIVCLLLNYRFTCAWQTKAGLCCWPTMPHSDGSL